MITSTAQTKVTLKKGRETRVASGHPWVFSGEVAQLPAAEMDGQVAAVEDPRGRFLGLGLVNTKSNILVRLLTRQNEPIDRAFFKRRLEEAASLRERFGRLAPTDTGYRLVHAEADG